MNFVELQRGRILKLYPGVVYESSLVGGYGYTVLLRKDDTWGNLLLILPGVYTDRPSRLEKVFKPLVQGEEEGYYMMFFPLEMGMRRDFFRAMGIVRDIGQWFVPALPENDDDRRIPWYWSSREEAWSFMPSGVSRLDEYKVSSVALLRMLRGVGIVPRAKKRRSKVDKLNTDKLNTRDKTKNTTGGKGTTEQRQEGIV